MKQEFLEIGKIVNTFGIKGIVKIVAFTDDITRFGDLKTIYVENKNEEKEYELEEVKYHKNMVLAKLKGINTVEQAEVLKESIIKINRKNAIKLKKDTYFIIDLLGLEVFLENEEYLGTLVDIYNTGSNDIYVVKDENSGKQILLPAISEVVKKIDIENKKITVQLLKGLI